VSEIKFVKSSRLGVADTPPTRVGEDVVFFDGTKIYNETIKNLGATNPMPILTSADIFKGVEMMKAIKVPIIYVVQGQVTDTYSLMGHYK